MVSEERHFEAMDKIGALVSVRERTCSELVKRLKKAGFTEEEAAEAVESAQRCGLVDEDRFTRAYIRGKSQLGWGKAKIIQRLQVEGVPQQVIASCEDEFPTGDAELEQALRELSKRGCTSKNPYASYMRRLVGKGYSYETASRAVKQHLDSLEER